MHVFLTVIKHQSRLIFTSYIGRKLHLHLSRQCICITDTVQCVQLNPNPRDEIRRSCKYSLIYIDMHTICESSITKRSIDGITKINQLFEKIRLIKISGMD